MKKEKICDKSVQKHFYIDKAIYLVFTIKKISIRPSARDCFLKIFQNLMLMVLLVSQNINMINQRQY